MGRRQGQGQGEIEVGGGKEHTWENGEKRR